MCMSMCFSRKFGDVQSKHVEILPLQYLQMWHVANWPPKTLGDRKILEQSPLASIGIPSTEPYIAYTIM